MIQAVKKAMEVLYTFYNDAIYASRVLGHVILSPPIYLGGAERYMKNYAIVKVDKDKIDRTKF